VRLQWTTARYNERALHTVMGEYVFDNQTQWTSTRGRSTGRWRSSRAAVDGRAEGPCAANGLEVRAAGLRGRSWSQRRSSTRSWGTGKWLTTYFPDGLRSSILSRRGATGCSAGNRGRWVRIPKEREAMHMLIVGDSGTGKKRGHPAGARADRGPGRDGHRLRSGARIRAAVLLGISGRRGVESVGRAVSLLDSG